ADVKAATQPAAVGDRFVVYAARRGLLQVVALDARTGSTAWSAAATPSQIAPGEPPVLTVIGGDVFYLGRRGGSLAELVARNVATGQVRWRSPLGAFTTWPGVCPDQTTAICLSGLLSTSSQADCRSEEHTSELQSQSNLVCRLLLEKKKKNIYN